MAYFYINAERMQHQADSLRKEARYLRDCNYELQQIIRGLQNLSCIQQQLNALEKLQSKTETEYAELLTMAGSLESIISSYRNTERRCERGTELAERSYTRTASGLKQKEYRILSEWQPKQFWREPFSWRQETTQIAEIRECRMHENLLGVQITVARTQKGEK